MEVLRGAPEPQRVNDAIITASLVPVAVANTMLFIGTNMKAEDCQFELRIFLIAAGALVLSLSIFSIMGKFLLDEMARGVGPRVKSALLYILSILNCLLRMTEVIIMITGAIIVMTYWSRVVFKKPPGDGDVYCDEGPFIFASIFFGLCLLVLITGGLFWIAWFIHGASHSCLIIRRRN